MNTIHIGVNKQLFIDRTFIERADNVALAVNPPVKVGPVELDMTPTGMVSIVEYDSCYYMYSRCEGGVGVARSQDGLRWETVRPPALGKGRRHPLPGVDSGGVFVDPKDDAYPFKGIFDIREAEPWGADPSSVGDVRPTGVTEVTARGGLYLFRSEDGLKWDLVPGLPVPFLCDTQNQVLYDTRLDRYVAYLRAFPTLGGAHNGKRCVVRTETRDLYHMPWPCRPNPDNTPQGFHSYPYIHDEMPIVMAADDKDPAGTDLYNPVVHLYQWAENVYLAFPQMYRCWGYSGMNISHGRDLRGDRSNDGLFETHMLVSRDGESFTRYRTPYLSSGLVRDRIGLDADLDSGLIMMAVGMVRRGDDLYQYYYGSRKTHITAEDAIRVGCTGEAIFRVVQRLDGFVSADADYQGGELVTPVMTFQGNRLCLNADCSGLGEIWVEIQDADGTPLPGHSIDNAVSIDRNGVAQEVWWQGGPDVSKYAGKLIRLRIRMRSAKLYAFQFVEHLNTETGGPRP